MGLDGLGGRLYDRAVQKYEERREKRRADQEAYTAEYKVAEGEARKDWAKRKAKDDARSKYTERRGERGGSSKADRMGSSMARLSGVFGGDDRGGGFKNPFDTLGFADGGSRKQKSRPPRKSNPMARLGF